MNIIHKIAKVVSFEIKTDFTLSLLGGANAVYKINIKNKPSLIIKLHQNKEQFVREEYALRIMKGTKIKSPKIIKSGKFAEKYYWIICEFINGKRLYDLNNQNLSKPLFFDLGQQLSLIHNIISFNELSQQERDYDIRKCFSKFVNNTVRYYNTLCSYHLPEQSIIKKAFYIVDKYKELYLIENDFKVISNDFSSKNLIVSTKNKKLILSGIIDFEFLSFGNLYRDFILLLGYFMENKQLEESFFRGYNSLLQTPIPEAINLNIFIFAFQHILESCCVAIKKDIRRYTVEINRLNKTLDFYQSLYH